MRVPSGDWFIQYMRAGGLVIAGVIIGSALFMLLHQHNFSLLYMEKERLKTENEDLKKSLASLEQNKNQSAVIRKITLYFLAAPEGSLPDEISTIRLRRMIVSDLDLLRGKSPDTAVEVMIIARRIIERKIYSLDKEAEYRVEPQLIVIRNGDMQIWIEAKPYIRSD